MPTSKKPSRKPSSPKSIQHKAEVQLGQILLNAKVPLPKEQASISVKAWSQTGGSETTPRLLGELGVSRGGVHWRRPHSRKAHTWTWTDFAALMAREGL